MGNSNRLKSATGLASGMNLPRRTILMALASSFAIRAYGATPVERVACLDWALAETMLALGVQPLAVVAKADWPRFVVEPPLPAATADLGLQQEVNFELLAGLDPDLILISPFLQHLAPQISRIAETLSLSVYEDSGAPLAHREEITRTLASRLRLEAAAEAYLDATDAELEALRARAASLPKRPLLLATFVDARHVRVYGGSSLFQNVLSKLGLENAWTASVGFFGFSMVGIEQLATEAELQLIAFDPIPPDLMPRLAQSPLWTELPFVRAGRFTTLPPVLMFGGLPSARRFARLLVDRLETLERQA